MTTEAFHLNLMKNGEHVSSSPVRLRVVVPMLAFFAAIGMIVWWGSLFTQRLLVQSNQRSLAEENAARNAAESEAKGFGGQVKTLTGIGADGRIINVIVSSHSETPGLGSQATDRKLKKSIWGGGKALAEGELPPNPYLDGKYRGKDAKPFSSVDGVSGATYSSTAVHNAVNKACRAYDKFKSQAN